jgi:hypothetical protein
MMPVDRGRLPGAGVIRTDTLRVVQMALFKLPDAEWRLRFQDAVKDIGSFFFHLLFSGEGEKKKSQH